MDYQQQQQTTTTTTTTAIVILLIIFVAVGAFVLGRKSILNTGVKNDDSKEEVLGGDAGTLKQVVKVSITPQAVMEKIRNKEDFVLLDVRNQDEYEKTHIVGAVFFPLPTLSEQALADFELGDKEAEVVIYCDSGNKSAQAYEMLSKWGYINLKKLDGGIAKFKEAVGTSSPEFLVVK